MRSQNLLWYNDHVPAELEASYTVIEGGKRGAYVPNAQHSTAGRRHVDKWEWKQISHRPR